MRHDRVPEDDPEFIKVREVLHAARQHNEMQKQRMAFKQQQLFQQQQQQSMQQHQNMTNGVTMNGIPTPQASNGVETPATSGLENGVSTQHAASVPPQSTSENSPTLSNHRSGAAQKGFGLTEDTRVKMRNQMVAFKLLSKDAPVPPEIQRLVFPSYAAMEDPRAIPGVEANNMAGAEGDDGARNRDSEGPNGTRVFESFTSPFKHIPKFVNYNEYSNRRTRPLIPGILPPGMDVHRTRQERETIIFNRMAARKAELENQNVNTYSVDLSKEDDLTPDTSLKLKLLIEYKKLNLLGKQKALREQISREIVSANGLAMTPNRAQYRRQKKQCLREARVTERLEKQQKDARESKERKAHIDYLKSIHDHREEIQIHAKEQKSRAQRLGRLMLSQHQTIEKEEQKRVERTAKQRLQALKANDEETYLKLLGQAKDSRISHLLKQTDNFLNQLAASVKSQQRNAAQRWGAQVPPQEDSESEEPEGEDEDGGKKVDYYEVAHRIKEDITEQSSNLVGGLLKEYQTKGLQWMISLYNNNLNGILADEMGLGKTIQTISLITYLIEKKRQHGPFLVVVPLSTLTNWNNEFEKWAPTVSRIVYKGPPNSRKQCQAQLRSENFQVLLTTYEFIIKDRPVLSKVKWLHMIVDEGHRMKNAGSKLSTTITNYYTTRFRIILTGTPLQNNLPELWALLNFVLPGIFKSVKSFDEWFNTPFANTGGQDKMDLTEEEQILVIRRLHKVLRPFLLRRLKKDVEKDLPDKQERVIKCTFSSLQAKLYKQLVTHNKLMVSDGKGGKTGMRGLSNMLMQLRKLCNHPFVFEEVENQMNPSKLNNDLLWRTAGKFELLDRILPKFQATGHRVLMFFQMTNIMNIMEDFMRLKGYQYLRLDGSTKSDERADLLKQFNEENSPYFCFLLSTRAGGLGLNLQAADTVVIFDSDWNPHQDLQAQDRAHRIGQKSEVRILRLISSNSVEEKILERAQFKLDMDGKVIQAGKFDNKSTNEERDAMLRVMLESAEAADSLETEEMDDDDLNMLMMRTEDEMEVFQRIDAERSKTDLYGNGKKKPRLLAENELPDIYLNEDVPVAETEYDGMVNYGRGTRERTRVKYDDGLTEEQWLDAVDNDEDTIEDAMARKQAKVARRVANKEKRTKGPDEGAEADTPPEGSREASESPVPAKRGRGRKSSGRPKRNADEASLDSESIAAPAQAAAPPKKRGRQAKPLETLKAEERAALQTSLDHVYDTLLDMEDLDDEDGTRPMIDAFIELPSKTDFPDYYLVIRAQDLICMEMMKKKINRKAYQGLDEFAADVRLMCKNCKTYNEDGTLIYMDAVAIEVSCRPLERISMRIGGIAPTNIASLFYSAKQSLSSAKRPSKNQG